MTNEELIERFLKGKVRGHEDSYGFYVSNTALYSKSVGSPIVTKVVVKLSKNCFVIMPNDMTLRIVARTSPPSFDNSPTWKRHIIEIHKIAKQLKIKFILSPYANPVYFQEYMEEKINENLLTLANDLRTGSYISVPRSTDDDFPRPILSLADESESYFAVPENYQKLMESIDALLEGERILELPKNQIVLVDTDEVQSLWRWLIKESPVKKDRELLREMYILSRLLGSPQREEEERKGGLIMMPNPW